MKLNFYRYRFPTALFLAISMALAPGFTEAAKKKDDKDHKKSNVHRVEKRSATVAQRSAPSRANVQRHVASSNRGRSAPKPQAVARHSSNDRKPQQRAVASRSSNNHERRVAATSHSRSNDHKPTRQQAIAASRDRKPDHSRNVASSNHVRNLEVAKARHDSARERRVVNRPRVLAASHRDHKDDRARAARAAIAASANRRADVRRDDGHRHHSDVVRRDRSNYTRRHDHHSHDWYVNNGWYYDRDYYAANHVHRYYNDYNRTYIIEVNGPGYSYPAYTINNGYGYGYAEPAPAYRDYGSGYDYTTRVLVQQQLSDAGYYGGAIDGDIGPGTRAAIAEYQYDAGMPTTGVIDEALLDSLGIQ